MNDENPTFLSTQIARAKSRTETTIFHTSINEIISEIKSEKHKSVPKKDKPIILWNAEFVGGKKESNITSYNSGFIFIDIDEKGLNGVSPDEGMQDLIKSPYCFFVCKSASQTGVHAVFLIENINSNDDFKRAYRKVKLNIYLSLSYTADEDANRVTQPQFIPADKNILIKENPQVYPYRYDIEDENEYYNTFPNEKRFESKLIKNSFFDGNLTKDNDLINQLKQKVIHITSGKNIITNIVTGRTCLTDTFNPALHQIKRHFTLEDINQFPDKNEAGNFAYIPAGCSYLPLYISTVKHGMRNNTLSQFAYQFLFLNPETSKNELYNLILCLNYLYCKDKTGENAFPMSEEECNIITGKVYYKKETGTLKPIIQVRKSIYNNSFLHNVSFPENQTIKERRLFIKGIIQKQINFIKKGRTLAEKFPTYTSPSHKVGNSDCANVRLSKQKGQLCSSKVRRDKTFTFLCALYQDGYTQKQLADLSGKSVRQIRRYWQEIKSEYLSLNQTHIMQEKHGIKVNLPDGWKPPVKEISFVYSEDLWQYEAFNIPLKPTVNKVLDTGEETFQEGTIVLRHGKPTYMIETPTLTSYFWH